MRKKILKKEGGIKDIFERFRKRDFRGNTGQAIKNSSFQFLTSLTSKIGSLVFTIIMARLLLPELFGLYSLALSTILIFATFSDLGFSQTLVKFLSSSKSAKKSKAYFSYILKFKIMLCVFSVALLFVLAWPIAYVLYNKPIFLALIAGSLYMILQGLILFFDGIFHSINNFKKSFHREIILQSFRLILVPIVVLFCLNRFSTEVLLFFIFIVLAFAFLVAFIFIYFSAKKEIGFLNLSTEKLRRNEKKKINRFVIPLSAIAISSVIFGYVDMVVLGGFVEAEFIGYYRAAFGLIVSISPLLTFSGALFPLFSKLKGKQLERGFKKTMRATLFLVIPVFILTFIFAPFLIRIIFGAEYSPSVSILRLLSVSLIIAPLIDLNSSFLISQNKLKRVAGSLISSSVLNVVLNVTLVICLLPYGALWAVYGVTIATIISKIFYLGMLVFLKR